MQLLSGHTGTWAGTNRFRLMPDDPPAEAPASAELSLDAGGHVATLRYTWNHPVDGTQHGLLALGAGESPGEVVALWGDSWHQQPAAQQLRGTAGEDTVTVAYTYAESWEWRITLTTDRSDALRWRMDNVVPASVAGEAVTYWAMEGELRRHD